MLEYLVCWKGYGAAAGKWLPVRDDSGERRLVTEFHKWNPEAPQCISAAYMPFSPSSPFGTSTNHPQEAYLTGQREEV